MKVNCKSNIFYNNTSIMLDSEYDGKIISGIISYLYGDKKTVCQIAKHLKIHQIQVTMYLDYLLKEEIIGYVEEKMSYGRDKYYYVCMNDSKIETRVSSKKNEIVKLADDFGNKIKKLMISSKPTDINNISYTVAMISEEDAQVIIDAQKKIERIMCKMESDSKEKESNLEKYIMVSMMTPYRIEN